MAHPPHSPDLAPCDYWLFARVKEHLRGNRYESEYDINTAVNVVTAYLHRLSKDEYKYATDRLPHRWKKYVDSAGDYTDYRKHVQTFRNISSVVNLYFVTTIKSYTELLK